MGKKEILELTNENIIYYNSNSFRPDDYITRAELINSINNTFKFSSMSNINFKDVASNSWYYNDIKKAISKAYIQGYDNGNFNPHSKISREEMAKIIGIACDLESEIPSP